MNTILEYDQQSKRQPIIALSSTEAEYIALSYAVKQILWLKQMAKDLDIRIDKNGHIWIVRRKHGREDDG